MLSRIARRGFATYKTSTGLVGLMVDPNGKETLLKMSTDVLSSITKIPSSSGYRTDVEKWFTFIHASALKHNDIKSIEDDIGLGQIEEVIKMAEAELDLIEYYHGN
jgi:ETC complex I subunit conserved region